MENGSRERRKVLIENVFWIEILSEAVFSTVDEEVRVCGRCYGEFFFWFREIRVVWV